MKIGGAGSYLCLFITVAMLAMALHAPGEISVDSGRQLHEAATGHSLSWNPPFMSAWLHVLGSAMVASSLFIFVNALVTYCGLAVMIGSLGGRAPMPKWRVALCIILALNPIFFYYVGIVWKDVLMATALVAVVSLIVLATGVRGVARPALLGAALVITAWLPLIRQQGIIIAPVFVGIVCFLAVRDKRSSWMVKAGLSCVLILCTLGIHHVTSRWVDKTIAGSDGRDFSSGFKLVMFYDVAGVAASLPLGQDSALARIPVEVLDHLRQSYAPDRVDKLMSDPVARRYLSGLASFSQFRNDWMVSIERYPGAFIRHRFRVLTWLLGFHDIEKCVPVYLGKSTLDADGETADGKESYDSRARLLGRLAAHLDNTPVFRNWFYLVLLLGASIGALFMQRGAMKVVAMGALVTCWLYLLSFIPTSIACDVRYLYPVAVLSTIGCIIGLLTIGVGAGSGSSGEMNGLPGPSPQI